MSPQRLHILMPCSRLERLPRIVRAYTTDMESHPWELRIHLLIQGPDPDPKGIIKVNECLREISAAGGWFMTVADDTIQHPALFRRMAEELEKEPDSVAIVCGQERHDSIGNLSAMPVEMRIGRVDGGQICWNRDWIRETRYEWEKFGIYCDGEFAVRLFAIAPQRFLFINEPLTRHNSLDMEDPVQLALKDLEIVFDREQGNQHTYAGDDHPAAKLNRMLYHVGKELGKFP